MFSYWAYILIGPNNTGKTTFQRHLVLYLCGVRYERLPSNAVNSITHPRFPKGLETLFTSDRSYQEKKSEYKSVDNYFQHFFTEAELCVLSSHDDGQDLAQMIAHLKRRFYNVAGVFWSNSCGEQSELALLPWDEVLWIDNPVLQDQAQIDEQLDRIAREFSELLLARAQFQ